MFLSDTGMSCPTREPLPLSPHRPLTCYKESGERGEQTARQAKRPHCLERVTECTRYAGLWLIGLTKLACAQLGGLGDTQTSAPKSAGPSAIPGQGAGSHASQDALGVGGGQQGSVRGRRRQTAHAANEPPRWGHKEVLVGLSPHHHEPCRPHSRPV